MTEKDIAEITVKTLLILLKEKRYADITVSDIAAKAGISRGTFYRHFKNKEEAVEKYISFASADFIAKTSGPYPRTKEDYYEIFFSLFALLKQEREIFLIFFAAGKEHAYFQMLLEGITEKVAEGGEEKGTPREVFFPAFVAGALYGVTEKWLADGCREPVKTICDIFFECFPFPPSMA